jgi:hypothetical protein
MGDDIQIKCPRNFLFVNHLKKKKMIIFFLRSSPLESVGEIKRASGIKNKNDLGEK